MNTAVFKRTRSVLLFAITMTVVAKANVPLVCGEYVTLVAAAHDALVVRDNQTTRIADVADPFDRAALLARGLEHVPENSPNGAAIFRRDFNDLLGTLTPENFAAQTDAFRARWNVPARQLLTMLLPYALYRSATYPGLAAAMPDRAQSQRALARVKLDEYRAEHPRLEARYQYFLENRGTRSVPEMAHALSITEPQVYREISALFLEITFALDRPLSAAERTALGTNASITTASDAVLDANRRNESDSAIAATLAMTPQRLSFFLHSNGVAPRRVNWDRWVQDARGVRRTEDDYLRYLDGQPMTVVEMATELNRARERSIGRPIGPEEVGEFRTYAATKARLATLGLTAGTTVARHDVYRLGYGAVVANGRLRAPEALEYLRNELSLGRTHSQVAHDLGLSETAVREFERKMSEDPATGLPSAIMHLLDAGPGATAASTNASPPPGPSSSGAIVPSSRLAQNIDSIVEFILLHENDPLGAKPRVKSKSGDLRENERALGAALSYAKLSGRHETSLALLKTSAPYLAATAAQRAKIDAVFGAKKKKLYQRIEAIVAFALANLDHPLGPSPRQRPVDPRPNEKALGAALANTKAHHAGRALEELKKSAGYRAASPDQQKVLENLFDDKRGSIAENVASIVAFALANENHELGPRPRQSDIALRENELRLANALVHAKMKENLEEALKALRASPGYVAANDAQKAMLEAMFTKKKATFEENIEAIVHFALAERNSVLGSKPRSDSPRPRPNEEHLALALNRSKSAKHVADALAALRATDAYQKADAGDRAMLENLFVKERPTLKDNLNALAEFVIVHENDLEGCTPRTAAASPRAEEIRLGQVLYKAKREANRAKALALIKASPAYAGATTAQRAKLEALLDP